MTEQHDDVKKPRKPKTPGMSMGMKFEVMQAIRNADPSSPDATVAAALSAAHGREISAQQVGKYRADMGLARVRKQTAAELMSELAASKARIKDLEAGAVPDPDADRADEPASIPAE